MTLHPGAPWGALLALAGAALLLLTPHGTPVAALAGAFADTGATEAGPLLRGRAFGLRSGRLTALPHGTPGGMSAGGFLAAALAALAVAAGAWAARLLESAPAAWTAAGAGFLASVLESLIAGTTWGTRMGHFG